MFGRIGLHRRNYRRLWSLLQNMRNIRIGIVLFTLILFLLLLLNSVKFCLSYRAKPGFHELSLFWLVSEYP